MRMEHLIHVNLCVSDLDRSLEFYRDLLGGVVVDESAKDRSEFMESQGEIGDTGHRAAFLAFGDNLRGPYIDLLEWNTPDPGRPLTWKSIGIPRIAVGVDDVDGFYERLSEAGADILGPPGSLKVGRSSIRAFAVRDPDGILIEFVTRQ